MTLSSRPIQFLTLSSLLVASLACSKQEFLGNIELPTFPTQENPADDNEQTQPEKHTQPKTNEKSPSIYSDIDSAEEERENSSTNSQSPASENQKDAKNENQPDTQNTNNEESLQGRSIKSMSLLGDSIGVGMVSGSKLGHLSFSNQVLNNIGYDLIQGSFNIESYDAYFKENGYNPFTSQKIDSLAVNLGLSESNSQNLAVSGSRIYQISDQISQMRKSELVVLEVGSNDICASDHELNDFLKEYETVLRELKNQVHKPAIVVVPAFPVHKLLRYTNTDLFKNLGPFGNSPTCQDSYALMCGALLNLSKEEILKRYQGINDGIESLVKNLDPKSEQLFIAPRSGKLTMKSEYLAMDCFHPNYNFNKEYSKMIWDELESSLTTGN
ncbi:MAG: SGNH/GDSL hydrolase family protein [Oligoflexales bacterium]